MMAPNSSNNKKTCHVFKDKSSNSSIHFTIKGIIVIHAKLCCILLSERQKLPENDRAPDCDQMVAFCEHFSCHCDLFEVDKN